MDIKKGASHKTAKVLITTIAVISVQLILIMVVLPELLIKL